MTIGHAMGGDAMDRDLEEARSYLDCTTLTVDRCRHPSIAETSLWIFDESKRQVGSARRLDATRWTFSRMVQGQPVTQRTGTLVEGCAHIVSSDRNA